MEAGVGFWNLNKLLIMVMTEMLNEQPYLKKIVCFAIIQMCPSREMGFVRECRNFNRYNASY